MMAGRIREIRACLAACAAMLLAGPGLAVAQEEAPAGKSILFTEAEVSAVTKAILDFERMKVTGTEVEESTVSAPQIPNIFVSALAYYGEGQWTVWANGYRVSPGRQAPGFTVISVSEDKVEIAVGGSKPAHFALRPYQTWRSRSNDIVEGIVP